MSELKLTGEKKIGWAVKQKLSRVYEILILIET